MKLHIIFDQAAVNSLQQGLENAATGSFARLLGAGAPGDMDGSITAKLCRAAGISKQADWPVAAISKLGDDVSAHDDLQDGPARRNGQALPDRTNSLTHLEPLPDAYWLCADLVHLGLQRDYFTLAELLPLAQEESLALLTAFNRHFDGQGYAFVPSGDYKRWYLRLPEDPGFSTTSPELALGLETTFFMPQGKGAAKWHRMLNEMQMLLFEHPVNQAREQRGELPVNSLWLSGGGTWPALGAPHDQGARIFGKGAFIRGLQAYLQQKGNAMPVNAESAFTLCARQGNHTSPDTKEAWLWMDTAYNAEHLWFTPLLQALKKRKLEQVTLYFLLQGHWRYVQINALDTWKFWRKRKSLLALLAR